MTVFPLATVPVASSYPPNPLSSALVSLTENQDQGQYLVEISAYKGGEARSGGLATLTEIPLATIPKGGAVNVGLATLRYGDAHWVGSPTDTQKPNVFYEGRVAVPLVIERAMPLLPEEPRRVQRQFGSIEIENSDGALDPILQSYAVDGRRVRVLFGPLGGAYSDFAVIADVLGTGWEGTETTVRLNVRDKSYSLDLPLQDSLYTGAGGAEGTSEIQGKPKPLTFGRARNITPVLIDPTNLVYQFHDGTAFAVDDVFDKGAALTASGSDVASYAALVAASVPAGQYTTALAVGMFKLGSSPAGLITADVRGDATGGYVDTLDLIALRVLQTWAGLASRWISTSTFAGAAAIGGEMGIYLDSSSQPTAADVLNTLMASAGAWWGAGRDGRIRAGRLVDPGPRAPNLYLDQYDILSLVPEQPPVPRWRQKASYQPNWTQQRGEDLAASVTDARRQFLTETVRVVTSTNGTVKIRHLQALDPDPLPTLYESSTAAQAVADNLGALHAPDRRIFTMTLKRFGYRLDLGSFVRVTYPKFGLNGGQTFTVIGIREDADRDEQSIRLFG